MDEAEFRQLLAVGHELSGIEFKSGGSRSEASLLPKVAKAAMAMANRRGGGKIVVGVREHGERLIAEGIAAADLGSWQYDAVVGAMARYVDPHVEVRVERLTVDTLDFIVVLVEEFQDVPVLCKRDYPGELRAGACYVRRRGRTETTAIPNHAERRALLDLAVEKGVRRFLQMASRAGISGSAVALQTNESQYDEQLEDFDA